MAPSAISPPLASVPSTKAKIASAVIHRNLKAEPLQVAHAEGSWVTFTNGQRMFDTTCGAAVACIGHNDKRVKAAIMAQMDKFAYCNSMFFGTGVGEDLARELINGTQGKMSKALVVCSGEKFWPIWFLCTSQ